MRRKKGWKTLLAIFEPVVESSSLRTFSHPTKKFRVLSSCVRLVLIRGGCECCLFRSVFELLWQGEVVHLCFTVIIVKLCFLKRVSSYDFRVTYYLSHHFLSIRSHTYFKLV